MTSGENFSLPRGICLPIPLRYLDAAELLEACDVTDSKALYPLYEQVEAFLSDSGVEVVDAPEYRAAIAGVMGEMQSGRFLAPVQSTLLAKSESDLYQLSLHRPSPKSGPVTSSPSVEPSFSPHRKSTHCHFPSWPGARQACPRPVASRLLVVLVVILVMVIPRRLDDEDGELIQLINDHDVHDDKRAILADAARDNDDRGNLEFTHDLDALAQVGRMPVQQHNLVGIHAPHHRAEAQTPPLRSGRLIFSASQVPSFRTRPLTRTKSPT